MNNKKQTNLFAEIADFIIKNVQKDSMSGFQCTVSNADIQAFFSVEIQEFISKSIIKELCKREEVADAEEDTDGFDVILYTAYAPNYVPNNDDGA